jgi:hypothetical protein
VSTSLFSPRDACACVLSAGSVTGGGITCSSTLHPLQQLFFATFLIVYEVRGNEAPGAAPEELGALAGQG